MASGTYGTCLALVYTLGKSGSSQSKHGAYRIRNDFQWNIAVDYPVGSMAVLNDLDSFM